MSYLEKSFNILQVPAIIKELQKGKDVRYISSTNGENTFITDTFAGFIVKGNYGVTAGHEEYYNKYETLKGNGEQTGSIILNVSMIDFFKCVLKYATYLKDFPTVTFSGKGATYTHGTNLVNRSGVTESTISYNGDTVDNVADINVIDDIGISVRYLLLLPVNTELIITGLLGPIVCKPPAGSDIIEGLIMPVRL